MSNDRPLLDQLIARASQTPGRSHLRPVIEKEILHYDILYALQSEGLLDGLTFQGGTSLRLCRGSNRYSEDLDFVGGSAFESLSIARIKECLETYIHERYGLPIQVKAPAQMATDVATDGVRVDKWQVAIQTSPGRPDIPKQRIKLEVCNLPAYTGELLPLKVNYEGLPDGYSDLLIRAETLDEVLADKLVSLPACERYIRHRDIWDIRFLLQKGAMFRGDLVENKIKDYREEGFLEKLSRRIDQLPAIIDGADFRAQMTRFLPEDVLERTLSRPGFAGVLARDVGAELRKARNYLAGSEPEPVAEFTM